MTEKTLTAEDRKANRARLVAALRSGEYTQVKGSLCIIDPDTKKDRYCCLGVASVLIRPADSELGIGEGGRKHWKDKEYLNFANHLNMTKDIRDAYGFRDQSGGFKYTTTLLDKFPRLATSMTSFSMSKMRVKQDTLYLTTLNDTLEWSFKEIADLIEYEPEGMFID